MLALPLDPGTDSRGAKVWTCYPGLVRLLPYNLIIHDPNQNVRFFRPSKGGTTPVSRRLLRCSAIADLALIVDSLDDLHIAITGGNTCLSEGRYGTTTEAVSVGWEPRHLIEYN